MLNCGGKIDGNALTDLHWGVRGVPSTVVFVCVLAAATTRVLGIGELVRTVHYSTVQYSRELLSLQHLMSCQHDINCRWRCSCILIHCKAKIETLGATACTWRVLLGELFGRSAAEPTLGRSKSNEGRRKRWWPGLATAVESWLPRRCLSSSLLEDALLARPSWRSVCYAGKALNRKRTRAVTTVLYYEE